MTKWDLNRLRYTVRKLTGKYDVNQLPDSSNGEPSISNPPGIDDYLNDFYLYDFPEECKTLKLKDYYTFTTIPNCGTYNVPQNVIDIEPPIYIDNYQCAWHQSPDEFYRIWPEFNFIEQNLFSPDGVTTSFTFTLPMAQNSTNVNSSPLSAIQQGTVVIGLQPNISGTNFANMETFVDSDPGVPLDIPVQRIYSQGTLTGNQGGTGTINYLTGAVTINYANAPPNGVTSSCHYHPYIPSRPNDVLFFQQQLFFRAIPNDTYLVKVLATVLPTTVISAATNATVIPSLLVDPTTTPNSAPTSTTVQIQGFTGTGTDLPQFNEWWQMLAYGAALKIFAEDVDSDQYQILDQFYQKQRLLAQRKALRQLANQRIPTVYGNSNNGGVYGNGLPTFPYY